MVARFTNEGFTLLEILLALIVLSVGVVALVWALSSGMFASTDIENVDLALNIAQAKMEYVFNDLKNTDLESLNMSNYESNNSGTDPIFSDFTVTVDLADQSHPHQELLQIDVTTTWSVRGGQTSVTLTTLVADLDL